MIEKDKVASVHAVKDAKFTTVIFYKGMGDDIGVHALSEAAQQRIVASGRPRAARASKRKCKRAFQRSGKSIVLAVCSLVLTAAFYYIVSSLHSDRWRSAPAKTRARKSFCTQHRSHPGANGDLVAGGLVTALFVFAAFKNSKKNWVDSAVFVLSRAVMLTWRGWGKPSRPRRVEYLEVWLGKSLQGRFGATP